MPDDATETQTDDDVIARFNALVAEDKAKWVQKFRDLKTDVMNAAKTPLYQSGLPGPLAQTVSFCDQTIQQLGG